MAAPPLLSTVSAITELFVTVAVVLFFRDAVWRGVMKWRWITVALTYELLFNITYMVSRTIEHEEGVTHSHPTWVTAFAAGHGILSLLMFVGLIVVVGWAYTRARRGDATPLHGRTVLGASFLTLWGLSILSGEFLYVIQWTDLVHTHD